MTADDKYELRGVAIMFLVGVLFAAAAVWLFGCTPAPTPAEHSVMVPEGYGQLQQNVEAHGKRLDALELINSVDAKVMAELDKRIIALEEADDDKPCPRPPGKLVDEEDEK